MITPARILNRQRAALVRLVTWMLEAAGVGSGTPATMRPGTRSGLLYHLQPAESALRRLIYVLALKLDVTARKARRRSFKPFSTGEVGGDSVPPFKLFDPRKRFKELSGPRKFARGPGPRIWFMDGTDPAYTVPSAPPKPRPGDPVDATQLRRRLQSLKAALDDMPTHAKRMARAMARRELAPPGPGRVPPLRCGDPPGHRKRGRYETDDILRECHQLALWVQSEPDTS